MNHYVYETYSEYDERLYIGVRSCRCSIEEDSYMGSHSDKTFRPTSKRILCTFETRKEAQLAADAAYHSHYADYDE